MSDTKLKDSGQRSQFRTGAVRDLNATKGRFDLLPPGAVRQVARLYQIGNEKYPDGGGRNWERGIPLRSFLDSALRHLFCFMDKQVDEPHLVQATWNLLGLIQTVLWVADGKLSQDLSDDFPFPVRLIETDGAPSLFPASASPIEGQGQQPPKKRRLQKPRNALRNIRPRG